MKRKAAWVRGPVWMVLFCLAAVVYAQFSEEAETGHRTLPNGSDIAYRVRLLPLASFPNLPLPVLQQLTIRHCLIPQTFEARGPENVIHGGFRSKGSDDWAVLCSQNGATTLYVFFGDQPESPVALRTQPDSEWLGAEYKGAAWGSAWGIAVRHQDSFRSGQQGGPFDHDGIEDAQLERSSTIHYYQTGKWLTVNGGD